MLLPCSVSCTLYGESSARKHRKEKKHHTDQERVNTINVKRQSNPDGSWKSLEVETINTINRELINICAS